MTVAHDLTHRGSTVGSNALALEDKFEVLKEIGDGSFGSVVLARVRTAGAHVARRGTVVSPWELLVTTSWGRTSFAKVIHYRLPSKQ